MSFYSEDWMYLTSALGNNNITKVSNPAARKSLVAAGLMEPIKRTRRSWREYEEPSNQDMVLTAAGYKRAQEIRDTTSPRYRNYMRSHLRRAQNKTPIKPSSGWYY